jgi:hypothetical protein
MSIGEEFLFLSAAVLVFLVLLAKVYVNPCKWEGGMHA